MSGDAVTIRPLVTQEEFERGVELQKIIWGFDEAELVPLRFFVVAAGIGGQVLGAFDGEEMIGFVLSVPGYRQGRSYLHSHMAAVLPAYQGRGIGRRLKLEQRRDALARGLELVEWTFDPLAVPNAHFNIERLGVIVRRYLPNLYGRTSSPLHGGLPTDRLLAEWWLTTPRVEAVVRGQPVPRSPNLVRLQVPAGVNEMKEGDPLAAERIQSTLRAQFQKWFDQGYAVTGFDVQAAGGTYLLELFPGKT